MLIAVTYHYVRPDFSGCSGGINGLTPREFEDQLALLGKRAVFVSASDVLDAVAGKTALPSRALLVTFDDGLREQYECALPVLNRMGIPALFFVNTRPIVEQKICTVHQVHLMRAALSEQEFRRTIEQTASELQVDLERTSDPAKLHTQYPYDSPQAAQMKFLLNFGLPPHERVALIESSFSRVFPGEEREMARRLYMDADQIATLGRMDSVGTHGHDHLPIGQITEQDARSMITLSVSHLERWTGSRPFALSYPYGVRDTCSPETAAIAQQCGIRYAFTVESAGNDAESLKVPQFLARFDCNLLPGGKHPLWQLDELFENTPTAQWHRPALAYAKL